MFGKNKLTQDEALKLRLERRKELLKEREQAGLSVADEDIEKALDNEDADEKEKRKVNCSIIIVQIFAKFTFV